MMSKLSSTILLVALTVLCSAACAADSDTQETCRIRVQNAAGGLVQVSADKGNSWNTVGRVRVPANARITGFSASSYTPSGAIAATAVHGLRIKTGQAAKGFGKSQAPMMFSIEPAEFAVIPKGYGGHIARSAAVYTDIPAGHSIFRNLSPYVGNSVLIERKHSLHRLPEDYLPQVGDSYIVLVERPAKMPSFVEFENRGGGSVTVHYPDGNKQILAEVDRPVGGVGRYDGTTFTGVGAINTNHGGVITISTAPVCPSGTKEGGEVETRGGFMIQPYYHVMEQGEDKVQVMVIGPKDKAKPVLEGTPPLFFGCINLSSYSRKPDASYRAQIRIDDGEWEDLPRIVGKADNAFSPTYLMSCYAKAGDDRKITKGVTAIRIVFPKFDAELLKSDIERESGDYAKRAAASGAKPVKGKLTLRPEKGQGSVSFVNFIVDGRMVGMVSESPFSYLWDTTRVSNGFHCVQIESVSDTGETCVENRTIFVMN